MNLLHSITISATLLLSISSACGMGSNRALQSALDISLLHACQDMENPSTWSEIGQAVLRCKSVKEQRLKSIEKKLRAGANPNAVIKDTAKNRLTGWAAIHWAVGNNSPELVALLLRHGADVNKQVQIITPSNLQMKTPFGIAMLNNGFLGLRFFNTISLRNSTAKPVSLEDAVRNNLKICTALINAGAAPQPGDEAKFAAFIQKELGGFSVRG